MKIKLGNRSLKILSQNVDPRLVHIALELQNEEVCCDAGVFESKRTYEKQVENVAKGVSGTLNSKHIPDKNEIVRAIDIVPYIENKFVWSRSHMDNIVAAIRRVIKRLGYSDVIKLGADFKTFNGKPAYDGYHIEIAKGSELK